MYRIGMIGWKLAARLGMPLSLRIHIHYDPEALSYWTTSPDLGSLIVTGSTLDELFQEVRIATPDLIALELGASLSKRSIPKTISTFQIENGLQSA